MSYEFKPTPGTWEIGPDLTTVIAHIGTGPALLVAQVEPYVTYDRRGMVHTISDEEAISNANLMAHAPRLLSVLKEIADGQVLPEKELLELIHSAENPVFICVSCGQQARCDTGCTWCREKKETA